MRNSKGFTLIELIVIIIILGILAATAIPKFLDLRQEAAEATAKGVLAALRGANNILYAQKVLKNVPAYSYSMPDIAANVEWGGGLTYTVSGTDELTVTIGGHAFKYTIDNYGNAPTVLPKVYASGYNW